MKSNEYIRAVRKSLRLNQKEFGKLFGKSREAIANYECSKRTSQPPAAFIKEVEAFDQKTRKVQKALNNLDPE